MKKIIVVLLALLSISSCYMSYDSIKPEDAGRFIHYQTAGLSSSEGKAYIYSPLAYQVYKGVNPLSEYSFRAITIGFQFYTFYGDPTPLLNVVFPDADVILSFGEYFYIGTKNK